MSIGGVKQVFVSGFVGSFLFLCAAWFGDRRTSRLRSSDGDRMVWNVCLGEVESKEMNDRMER